MYFDTCFSSSTELNVCFECIILLFLSNHTFHISMLSTNFTNMSRISASFLWSAVT